MLDVSSQPFYRITATCGYGHAVVGVSHAQAVAGPIEIELEQLLFERVSFVTDEGLPVPVEGRQECALFARQPIYESFFNVATYDVSWLPAAVTVATLKANELVYITTKRPPGNAARVIDFQGYGPVEIPLQLLPLRQWPEGREITLSPQPDEAPAIPHRVVFPSAALPDRWEEDPGKWLDIVASVTATGARRTYWVSRQHPVYRVPRGTDVVIKVVSERAPLPFSLREDRDEVAVLVEWPRYAYLDLRYPARHPDQPAATAVVSAWTEGTFAIGGRLVEPGHARFAYLVEGNCFVEISWWKSDEPAPFSSWRARAPMGLAMGLNEFEVRENDTLAETKR